MEEEATNKEGGGGNNCNSFNYDPSWSSKTNWTIADGSLVNSITFESSLSPSINDDDDVHQNSNSNPAVKSPLILHPPSPDPSPCEITINFAQKFEVQQVYVRSTARVYEIYYASDLGITNEYLCTVQCGVATREEEVLCSPGFEAAAHLTGTSKESVERTGKSDSSLSTNEDGWLEVKSLHSPPLDNGSSTPSILNAKQGENLQDLYEATAQINDAEPCMSITLRMLSLQNKGCVFVDELYVFGDPVEPLDSDNRVGQVENQAGSSFMAMFMPTILQLSRTRSAGPMRVDQTVDTKEKHAFQGIGSKATNSTESASKILKGGDPGSADKQEDKIQERVKATSTPPHMQVSDALYKADSSSSHIERVLDQLVLRVSRMEDFFVRFEECMLKPINSIDARLQRVEQQLEELNEKPQNSGLRCTRISAPEFSWHESDDNFFGNSESIVVEPVVNDYTESSPADYVANSSNEGQSHSNLLVTHPFSSNSDGEEENNALEATVAANNLPKHAMSVDDALASALAGFLSSVSAKPHKYTPALAIKAPDFSVEEDSTSGKKASLEVEGERATDPPICCDTLNVNECTNDSVSTSTNTACLESEVKATESANDHHSDIAGDEFDEQGLHNEEGKDDFVDGGIYILEMANEDIKNTEVGDRMNNTSDDDECETKNQFLENRSDNDSGSAEDGTVLNSESTISEVKKERSDKDILQDFKISLASSIVDFEIPILDVKFIPQDHLNAKSPFEVLLDDIPETNVKCRCAKEHDGFQNPLHHNLISVDDTEPTNPASGNHFSLDMNYCSLDEMPLYAEVEELHDYNMSKKEACTASLI